MYYKLKIVFKPRAVMQKRMVDVMISGTKAIVKPMKTKGNYLISADGLSEYRKILARVKNNRQIISYVEDKASIQPPQKIYY